MKIALITVHKVTNYGAVLQAFASRRVLSRYGEVVTLDYSNKYLNSHLDVLRFKPSVRGIKMLVHDVLNLPNRSVLVRKFKDFIESNLNLSHSFSRSELEAGRAGNYDVYVCGSDQIWNPKIVNPKGEIDPMYFLSFAPEGAKKVSCASSMGNYEYSEQESITVRDLLKDFHRISVREKYPRTFLKSLLPEKEIAKVLDPTLLLTREQWLGEFAIAEKNNHEEFILVYSVPRTGLLRKAIHFYSEKFGLPVIAIDKMLISMGAVNKHIRTCGPKEFLDLFAKARFIITDSYHGTCFSVNFEKPFVCIPATPKANRQEDLLSSLDLADRIVYKEKDFSVISKDLDYSSARQKLNSLRVESFSFLEEAITTISP